MSSRHLRRLTKLNDDFDKEATTRVIEDADDIISAPKRRGGTMFAILSCGDSSSSSEEVIERDVVETVNPTNVAKFTEKVKPKGTTLPKDEEDIDSLLDRMLLEKEKNENGAGKNKSKGEKKEEESSIKLLFSPCLNSMNPEDELRTKFGIKMSHLNENYGGSSSSSSSTGAGGDADSSIPSNFTRKQRAAWKKQMAVAASKKKGTYSSFSKKGKDRVSLYSSNIPWIPISYNRIFINKDGNLEGEESLEWAQIRDLHSFELMFEFHQREPFNVDCCIAISDYLRMMNHTIPVGNSHGTTSSVSVGGEEFNERALEIIERGIGGNFFEVFPLAEGPKLISYDQSSVNRKLHGSLFRKCQFLIKRGTYRCALEWAKTLWSLDSRKDPLGALLFMDLLAIQSKENIWFWSFYNRAFERSTLERRASLANWQYSAALLARIEGSIEDSDSMLMAAFEEYPWMISKFTEALGLGSGFASMVADEIKKAYRPASLLHGTFWQEAMARIFASRSAPYWKSIPGIKDWFKDSLVKMISIWSNADKAVESGCDLLLEMQLPIFRHMILSDMPRVNGSLPPVLDYITSYDSDPLPTSSVFDDLDGDEQENNISPTITESDPADPYL